MPAGRGASGPREYSEAEPGETSYTVQYAFLLRKPDGRVRSVHDVHREGLFGEGLVAQLEPREIESDALTQLNDSAAR